MDPIAEADRRRVELAVDEMEIALKRLFHTAAFVRLPEETRALFHELAFKVGCARSVAVYRDMPADAVEAIWQDRRSRLDRRHRRGDGDALPLDGAGS